MKITFLGQAGLLFENNNSKIMIDPYLSDSVSRSEPENFRRQPVDARFFDVKPSAVLITHVHGDHYDRDTLCRFLLPETRVTVLSPVSVWQKVRAFGGKNEYFLFNEGTGFSLPGFRFFAVKAEHSDAFAVGAVIEDREEGKFYYVTGDTLYSEKVFSSLPDVPLEAVFLPINGKGNNMNMEDAARFAARTGAKYAVPVHFGMFDEISPEKWEAENKVIPKIYEEIVFR